MASLSQNQRLGVLAGLFAVALGGMLLVPPIPQDPSYHLFADTRSCLGIPNFGDLASNLGFAVVGLLGLWRLLGPSARTIFPDRKEATAYLVFFVAVGLVSLGSAYYHAAPDNARLFWDRLPMTVAFMALFYAILADRVPGVTERPWLLPLLVALGAFSLLYWDWTEAKGQGDLRFYGLVQFYPMIALPVICWLYPKAQRSGGGYLFWVIAWYALAKVLETFDAAIFDLLGRSISGHSLKHLAAAVACFIVLRMVLRPVPDEAATGDLASPQPR